MKEASHRLGPIIFILIRTMVAEEGYSNGLRRRSLPKDSLIGFANKPTFYQWPPPAIRRRTHRGFSPSPNQPISP
jgi:hypothetical protein